MAMTVHVDIVSAEKAIFSGLAEMVVASGTLGELGITPGHAPLLSSLKPGQVKLTLQSGKEEIFYISGGMLEVLPDRVTVLCDTAAHAADLNEAAALEAKKRAEALLADQKGDYDYSRAASELAQAAAQLEAIGKLRRKQRGS